MLKNYTKLSVDDSIYNKNTTTSFSEEVLCQYIYITDINDSEKNVCQELCSWSTSRGVHLIHKANTHPQPEPEAGGSLGELWRVSDSEAGGIGRGLAAAQQDAQKGLPCVASPRGSLTEVHHQLHLCEKREGGMEVRCSQTDYWQPLFPLETVTCLEMSMKIPGLISIEGSCERWLTFIHHTCRKVKPYQETNIISMRNDSYQFHYNWAGHTPHSTCVKVPSTL